jgi:hypothetical protein
MPPTNGFPALTEFEHGVIRADLGGSDDVVRGGIDVSRMIVRVPFSSMSKLS